MPTKNVAIKIKATAADDSSLGEGQFVALASVFNNVDAVGDVVKPGAFKDDLAEWKSNGDTIPVYWGHRMDDPNMCVGGVLEAAETDEGLQVKVQLDMDRDNAAQVYRLLKGRRVNRMSFAYDVVDGGWGQMDGQEAYELRTLKIHEVSVVQVPANPAAVVQEVKTAADRRRAALADTDTDNNADAAAKAGRSLSAKNESALKSALQKIADGITDIKSVLASIDSDDGKANPAQPAATEEPDGAKVDVPARPGPASFRLRTDLDVLVTEVDELIAA